MAKSYKSYMLSSDGQSWVPMFDGDSYNTLSDVPIKNLYSGDEDVYIDVGSLKEGKYRIFGYYKVDDDSELQFVENNPVFVSIYTDAEDQGIKYAVFENVSSSSFGQTIYTIENSAITATHEVGIDDTAIPEIHDDIDSLNNNLSELSQNFDSTVADINSTIEDMGSELSDDISNNYTQLHGEIEQSASEINSTIDTESDRLEQLITNETSTLNTTLTSEVTRIDSTLDNHSESLSSLDSQVAVIDTRLDGHDQSVSEFEDEFTLLNNTEDTPGSIRQIAKSYSDTATTSSAIVLANQVQPDLNDASTYVLSQGGQEIGRIHIAKDLVATKGELVSEDANGNTGTFIKMTVANGTPFYIPVDELIDIYQGSGDVGTVSTGIRINVSNGVISATVVTLDGSKLDTTSVGKTALSSAVQASLGKADSAIQSITEGNVNGQINVDGTQVSVHGLGTASFQNVDAFDPAGAAETAKNQVIGNAQNDTENARTIEGVIKRISSTINTLDGTATIATKSGNVVTLKSGINEVDGVVSNSSTSDIVLADVASTGSASDVHITDSGNYLQSSDLEAALQEMMVAMNGIIDALTWHTFT